MAAAAAEGQAAACGQLPSRLLNLGYAYGTFQTSCIHAPSLPCRALTGWDFALAPSAKRGQGLAAVTANDLVPLLQRHQPALEWDDRTEEHSFEYTVRARGGRSVGGTWSSDGGACAAVMSFGYLFPQ